MILLTREEKKRVFWCIAVFSFSLLCGIFIKFIFSSIYMGILVSTGIITLQAIIDIFNTKSPVMFPLLWGIISGICASFFLCILNLVIR